MSLTLTELAHCFPPDCHPRTLGNGDQKLNYGTIRFWDEQWIPDCLFIARASGLSPAPPLPELLQIILIEDVPCPAAWKDMDNLCAVLLSGNCSPTQIYNWIEDGNWGRHQSSLRIDGLLDAISDGQLEDIVQQVSISVAAPAALLDANLRVLAMSGCDEARFPLFLPTLRKGYYCGLDIRSKLFYNRPTARDPQTGKLSSLEDCDSSCLELFCPILADVGRAKVNGYVYLNFDSKENALKRRIILKYICKILLREFWRDYAVRIPGTASSLIYLLRNILDGTISNDEVIAYQLDRSNFTPKRNLLLLTVIPGETWSQHSGGKHSIEPTGQAISRLFPGSILCFYSAAAVVLLQSDELPVIDDDRRQKLDAFLRDNDCYAGMSEPFCRITQFYRNYYERAISAALYVAGIHTGPRSAFYADIALPHLALNLLAEPSSDNVLSSIKKYLVDPNLVRLIKYDRAHGTDYKKTLCCYWHFNKDADKIGAFLHIHRSTLFYRLNKIRSILQQDFNDYNNLIQLSIGIAILETMDATPREVFPWGEPKVDFSGT